jgi:hypothetical protein
MAKDTKVEEVEWEREESKRDTFLSKDHYCPKLPRNLLVLW